MGTPSTEVLVSKSVNPERFLLFNTSTETFTEVLSIAARDEAMSAEPHLTDVTGVELREDQFREQNQKGI